MVIDICIENPNLFSSSNVIKRIYYIIKILIFFEYATLQFRIVLTLLELKKNTRVLKMIWTAFYKEY